jgi:hypothetical protein
MHPQPFLLNRANASLLVETGESFVPVSRRVHPLTALGMLLLCMLPLGPLFIPAVWFGAVVWAVVEILSRPEEFDALTRVFGAFVFALAGGAGGAFMVIQIWPILLREYRLRRDGRVILGKVVSCTARTTSGYTECYAGGGGEPYSSVTVTLNYSFAAPSGGLLSGVVVRENPGPSWEPMPLPGHPMAALYLDDDKYEVL